MRSYYSSYSKDQNGRVIASATVSVYLAGTTTAANVYTTLTGTVAVNSVTSDSTGKFEFYVSRFDYDIGQQFKLVVSKAVSTVASYATVTHDYIDVVNHVLTTYTISDNTTVTTDLGYVPKGVIYSVASGKTLTINGPFSAGLYQVFNGAAGSFKFGNRSIKEAYPEWAGAKDDTDGSISSDAFEKIFAAAWSPYLGVFRVVAGSRSYSLDRTMYKPVNIGLDFNGAVIHARPGTYANHFIIATNTTDGANQVFSSPNLYSGYIKNAYFNHSSFYVSNPGMIAIGLADASVVENIQASYCSGIVAPVGNYFLDLQTVRRIYSASHQGTNPVVRLGRGDAFSIRGIHAYGSVPGDGLEYPVVQISDKKGGTIDDVILSAYSTIDIRRSTVSIAGCSFEGGRLVAKESNVTLNGSIFFKDSPLGDNYPPIELIDDGTTGDLGVNSSQHSFTGTNLQFIKMYERSSNYATLYDIITTGRWRLDLRECRRVVSFNSAPYTSIGNYPVQIGYRSGGVVTPHLYNLISHLYPNPSIFTTTNTTGQARYPFAVHVVAATSAAWRSGGGFALESRIPWNSTTGTYYYRVQFLWDSVRKIGFTDSNSEVSQAVVNGSTNGVRLTGGGSAIRQLTPMFIFRVYRGTSAGVYSEYADIPHASHPALFYDTGTDISGFQWIARTPGAVDSVYPIGEGDLVDGIVVVRGVTAAPTVGTWQVGDRAVRTPAVGQPKAWTCTVAGTPGTWVSEGNL